MRILALVVVAVALLSVTTARASSLRQDEEVARHTWGSVCDGSVHVRRASLPGRVLGLAAYSIDGDGRHFDCTVTLDPDAFARPGLLCTVVVHEFGHLAGHGHSRDPHSVMYPIILHDFHGCLR